MEFRDNEPESFDDGAHIIDAPFDAYDGEDPYIFVCYSHNDALEVFQDLKYFNDAGVNVFYDEGLPSAISWTSSIEIKIKSSALFVPFISNNLKESRFSRNEINLAYRLDIPILPIFLEETPLDQGLDLEIGGKQAIFKYIMDEEKYTYYWIREFKRHGFNLKLNDDSELPDLFTPQEKESQLSKSLSRLIESAKQIYMCDNIKESRAYANNSSSRKSSGISRVLSKIGGKNGGSSRFPSPNVVLSNENVLEGSSEKIYISYSSKDNLIANEVCSYLEENGMDCWIAPRNIKSSKNYVDETTNAIKNSKCVVLLFSRNSNESNYVANEIDLAFSNNKFIIPFRIDDSVPDGKLDFFLGNSQWIDAYPE